MLPLFDTRDDQGVEKMMLLVDIAAVVHVSKAFLQPPSADGHTRLCCDDRDDGMGEDGIILELYKHRLVIRRQHRLSRQRREAGREVLPTATAPIAAYRIVPRAKKMSASKTRDNAALGSMLSNQCCQPLSQWSRERWWARAEQVGGLGASRRQETWDEMRGEMELVGSRLPVIVVGGKAQSSNQATNNASNQQRFLCHAHDGVHPTDCLITNKPLEALQFCPRSDYLALRIPVALIDLARPIQFCELGDVGNRHGSQESQGWGGEGQGDEAPDRHTGSSTLRMV